MKVQHDVEHDAAYFAFTATDSARQVKLDDARIVDYAADGSVIGVEFISPSRGINVVGVPRASEIARAARRLGLPILSSSDTTRVALDSDPTGEHDRGKESDSDR